MALGPRLELKQSQQLVMTPQLQQAIKLLALSNVELESFLQSEMEQNPLLDSGSGEEQRAGDGGGSGEGDGGDRDERETDSLFDGSGDALDVNVDDELFQDGISDRADSVSGELSVDTPVGTDGSVDPGAIGSKPESLFDHLEAQAAALEGRDRLIARVIIESIDAAGYLQAELPNIAFRLGTEEADVERVLRVVQTFDPSGIGARTLSECLMIQARDADRLDPCMRMLISRLDLLARGELSTLRRLCRVDEEDLADMIAELRAYNPKPGLAYGSEGDATPVIPDVFVKAKAGGGWQIEINQDTLPKLLVNREYAADLSVGGAKSAETRAFLSDCLASANWLMNALDQRQRTIVKVASEIVKQQEGFFNEGVSRLRPLTMRSVAEEIEMHESTVSRVTSNKFLSCDRGTFELKYFFTSGVGMSEGEDVSANAVKNRIKELVAAETPKSVLSDDKLVQELKKEGFDLARRTVTKYRESIGIGSSVQRRRSYKISRASS